MKTAVLVAALLSAGIGAFLVWVYTSEFTDCYAAFDSPETAERAAAVARAAGFEAEVEKSGANSRLPSSPGVRRIAVTFSDGETGEDATEFRATFQGLVEAEDGTLGHSGNGCLERGMFD